MFTVCFPLATAMLINTNQNYTKYFQKKSEKIKQTRSADRKRLLFHSASAEEEVVRQNKRKCGKTQQVRDTLSLCAVCALL